MKTSQKLEYESVYTDNAISPIEEKTSLIELDLADATEHNVYVAEGDKKDDNTNDTEAQRAVKEIYRMIGVSMDNAEELEDDDEKERRIKSSVKLPDYTQQKISSSAATNSSQKETKTYKTQPDMEMSKTLKDSTYVCSPGSKGACASCPVYAAMTSRSLMPKAGQEVFQNFNAYMKPVRL